MSQSAKLLAAIFAGVLLMGADTHESAPQALVDDFQQATQQFGRDAWSNGEVRLGQVLTKLGDAHSNADSLTGAAYQARAAAELRAQQYSRAYFDAQHAEAIHTAIGFQRARAGDLLTQAQAEYNLGAYDPALDDLQRAQTLLHPLHDRDTASVRALLDLMRGETSLAIGEHDAAQASFRDAAKSGTTVLYHTARAYEYLAAGEAQQARAAYLLMPSHELALASQNLELAKAQFGEAIRSYGSLVGTSDDAAAPSRALCRSNARDNQRICSDTYFYQEVLRQGWTDPKWLVAGALLAHARALFASGDVQGAARELARADKDAERVGVSSPLGGAVASLQLLIEAQKASDQGGPELQHLIQSMDVRAAYVVQTTVPADMWRAQYDLARTYALLGMRTQALRAYDAAAGHITFTRSGLALNHRESFLEEQLRVYDDYIEYLLQSPHTDHLAFDMLAERQARETMDVERQAQWQRFYDTGSAQLRELMRVYRQARTGAWRLGMLAEDTMSGSSTDTEVKSLERTQNALLDRYIALRDRLETSKNSADLRFLKWSEVDTNVPVHALTDIEKRVLRRHETMLVYAWLPHEIAIWSISKDHYRGVHIVPRSRRLDAELRRAFIDNITDVRAARLTPAQAQTADYLGSFKTSSRNLYRALVEGTDVPVSDDLIIVPSGPLYDVAWEALVTGKTIRGCPGGYFICVHAISYAASPETFAIARELQQPATQRSFLAFARPVTGRRSVQVATRGCNGNQTLATLDDLPGTEEEAVDSAHAFGRSARRDVEIGEAASSRRLTALNAGGVLAQYRYVLFATHALLPGESCAVREPSIVLSHSLTTVSEVSALRLNARVVLLSACSTGAYFNPQDRPLGDGISGMTRAFLVAGSRSVGVTLWDVYDRAGPQLVPRFFRGLADPKRPLTPAKALQQAKIVMINGPMRHPFFWAPTVLYGDADR